MNIKALGKSMADLSPTCKIASSLILKDAVGCYLYVSQARSNKKMTPQQRADVANYDLANGVINVGLQLLAVKPIETLMEKFVDKRIIKHFFHDYETRIKDFNSKEFPELVKTKIKLTKGAVAVFSVIICQYFIKRCVSPFFSVPAGEKSKQIGLIKPKLYDGETFEKSPKGQLASKSSYHPPYFMKKSGSISSTGADIVDFKKYRLTKEIPSAKKN